MGSLPYVPAGKTPPLAALVKLAGAWRPEPGEQVDGTIRAIVKRTSEYGVYPAVLLEVDAPDDAGEIHTGFYLLHMFHEVLKNQLIEMRPKADEKVSVLYSGVTQSSKGVSYHNYTMWRTEEDSAVDAYDFGDGDEPQF